MLMNQISDKKNKEENRVEHLSLSEAMKKLNERKRCTPCAVIFRRE